MRSSSVELLIGKNDPHKTRKSHISFPVPGVWLSQKNKRILKRRDSICLAKAEI
jgi:hypothetical protein